MSTLAELRARCARRLKDISYVDTSSDTLDALLNEGYFTMLAASQAWPFLDGSTNLTVTGGTNTGSLPTGVSQVTAVFNSTDEIRMAELPGRIGRYDAFPDLADSAGVPIFYRLRASVLEVFPQAQVDTVVKVEYPLRPVALTAGDSPIFPAQYHHGLTYWALAQAFLDSGGAGRYNTVADHYTNAFNLTLQQMKTDLLGARGDSYPQINDNWDV